MSSQKQEGLEEDSDQKQSQAIYQTDVKSVFLYGTIDEEVYVIQPPGFHDPEFPARVYKVEKAMYELHQAPRAWHRGDFILVQVYVDDIIFGSSNPQLCIEFEALMHDKFQMSAMDELNFFLSLYSDVRSANTSMDKENPWGKDRTGKDVDLHLYRSMIGSLMYLAASRPDIMFAVYACAKHQVTPKECHMHAVKRIFRYLKSHPKLGLWYAKESPFDSVAYSDSDYGGATQDRKSTTGGCQFLGRRLISWKRKKQTIVATSTTEAEYVAVASGCRQVLWIQNQLLDYGIKTTEEGTKILATVDGKLRTIFESSIRRNLKLNDEAGISSLPDAELFENLTLMGYNISPNQKFTFQKGKFSHQWKYLIHTIMQWLSPKSTGFNEFSSNIATTLVCRAINRVYNFSKMIFEVWLRIRARIAQSSALPTVADEPASPLGDGSQGEACFTFTGLVAGQDRENITKTSTLPSDSTPKVTSPATDKEMAFEIEAQELEITNLKARVKSLKDREGGGIVQSGDDAPFNGRSLDEGEEAVEKGSSDTEEMKTVLTSLDATIVLSSGVAEFLTVSGSIPTSGPPATGVPTGSDVVPTASPIFTTATESTPYTRRKGKEKMVEFDTSKKKKLQEQIDVQVARELEEELARDVQRMNEQIARDAEIARIYAEEELQIMFDGLDRNNETTQQRKSLLRKQQKDLYMSVLRSHAGWKAKHFKGMTLEEIKEKFDPVLKHIQYFIPTGSKEESERFKRKGLRLEQESSKKLKTLEEVPEEKLKEMMELIPVEEIYVEALQVKHPSIDWEFHTKGKEATGKL
nr:hypothetical protein [Tanacetum cinerariifolium]